jgi:Flp pilus assembly pilin Flp
MPHYQQIRGAMALGLRNSSPIAILRKFLHDEQGQDLIEYTLLMAFVALASAALFLGAGHSIKGIWTTTNSQLTYANTLAS